MTIVELQLMGVLAGLAIAWVLTTVCPEPVNTGLEREPGVARDCFVPRNDGEWAGDIDVTRAVENGVSGSVLMKLGRGPLVWLLIAVMWVGFVLALLWHVVRVVGLWLAAWCYPVKK